MSEKIRISLDDLRYSFDPIPTALAKSMLSIYDNEMGTGEYSPNDALYHAIDQAKEEIEFEFEFTSKVREEELDEVLTELFYRHW